MEKSEGSGHFTSMSYLPCRQTTSGKTLSHLWPMRCSIWSSLSIHLQLCWTKEQVKVLSMLLLSILLLSINLIEISHFCYYYYLIIFYRGWFLMFTLSVAINCSITIFFACYCISIEGWKLLYIIGLIEALIFCGLGWLLSGFTVSQK